MEHLQYFTVQISINRLGAGNELTAAVAAVVSADTYFIGFTEMFFRSKGLFMVVWAAAAEMQMDRARERAVITTKLYRLKMLLLSRINGWPPFVGLCFTCK